MNLMESIGLATGCFSLFSYFIIRIRYERKKG
nr:MAG TPA: High-affinity nitrate transporter accessory [Caudoviricetes sp.]